jgi:TatD DNase family protein
MPQDGVEIISQTTGYFSVGMHPWYLKSAEKVHATFDLLRSMASSPECIAIGEAGLDKLCHTPWELQVSAFRNQIHLSEQIAKPLIIHCVKSYNEILVIRKEMNASQPWIFHAFNSSAEMAYQIIESGCFLSFGHLLLKSRSKAMNVIKSIQANKFFIETDDADLGIEEVYNKAAGLRNADIEMLKEQQIKNFKTIFREIRFPS